MANGHVGEAFIPHVNHSDGASAGRHSNAANAALRGLGWSGVGIFVSKIVSLVAQIALGWLLAPSDFAAFAIAISLSTFVGAFQHAGLQRLLLQSGSLFSTYAAPAFRLALWFNIFLCALLIMVGILAAQYFQDPSLRLLVVVLAVGIPFSTPVMFYSTCLAMRSQYRSLAIAGFGSTALKGALMVALAEAGHGALSFVVPVPTIAIVEWIVYRHLAGPLPATKLTARELLSNLGLSTQRILLAGPAGSLVAFGDYLVVGKLARPLLADYFFGYQLVNSVLQLFSAGVSNVLVPAFSRVGSDGVARCGALMKAARVLVTVCTPIGFVIALWADVLIEVIWQGKWMQAAIVVKTMGIALPLVALTPLALAAIQATGNWGLYARVQWIHAASTIMAATVGALSASLLLLTSVVSLQHIANALGQIVAVIRIHGGHSQTLIFSVLAPHLLGMSLFIGLCVLDMYAFGNVPQGERQGLSVVLFLLLYCGGLRLCLRSHAKEVSSLLQSRRG